MANPTLLKTPIASGGDKNTIPETTGSTTGLLSQEKGWQQINSLPINAGGIAPSRLDFNGVFNLLSNILFYTQKGWQWEFDETQNYFAGCTVKDTVDGKTYVCIADVSASTTHPSADATHWKLSDLATKSDLANYLPLAGGSMTGTIIRRDRDNSELLLYGGNANNTGGFLELFGSTASNANKFRLQAGSEATARLEGKPDGTLTWGGYNIITDANGGYLPLAGGTMTGNTIKRSVDNGEIMLAGGSSLYTGALLQLNGSSRSGGTAGKFELLANNGTNTAILRGSGDGTLTWANNDLGGSAIVAKSLGTTGYTKRADGLIEQWGRIDTDGTTTQQVSFPISFSRGLFSLVITREFVSTGTQSGNLNFFKRNNLSSFIIDTHEASTYPMDWIAVGM